VNTPSFPRPHLGADVIDNRDVAFTGFMREPQIKTGVVDQDQGIRRRFIEPGNGFMKKAANHAE
jgi:hypothetical protein